MFKALGATVRAKHGKFSLSPLSVQPRNGHSTRGPRLLSAAVANTGASHTLLYCCLVESAGGKYDPSQTLQIEQFIGHQVESTLGAGVAGSGSIPLVNSDGNIVELPISGSDHVIIRTM